MKRRPGVWIVEDGEALRAVTSRKPTKAALDSHGLSGAAVSYRPPPVQKSFSFEADTFALFGQTVARPVLTTDGADFRRRAEHRARMQELDLEGLSK